jgi:long-chain acyl-CoA synthetase
VVRRKHVSVPQSNAEFISLPEVKQVMNDEINRLNKTLSESEKILRFRLLSDEWSPTSGELSATLKLKRKDRIEIQRYP